MDVYDSVVMMQQLEAQARVHDDGRKCVGLPFCASCRCATLIKNEYDITVAEAWINAQEPGTVVRL